MAGLLGKVDAFDPDWPQYVERLEHFFEDRRRRERDQTTGHVLICDRPSTLQTNQELAIARATR